eukprot:jgi/Orpsp1_1/1182652/evm.model.c7180000082121.1
MDFITFEPNKNLRFYKKSSSRNLEETGSPKIESSAKSIITINNSNSDQIVGFKIKTTSPHSFCVRPSVGKVLPNEKAEISIYIRSHDLNVIKNDKFLIQTTIIPNDIINLNDNECVERIGEIFKKLEKLKKSNSNSAEVANLLKEHRLLCDISALPNIKTDETKKASSPKSPESPNSKEKLASPLTPNVTSPIKKNNLKDNELLEKNPQNISEANAIIKELENEIQKYSVEIQKSDLIKTRRYGKESINDFTVDGKKENTDPKELFFEWNEKSVGK